MVNIKGVEIEWLGHSGFLIRTKEGKKIVIDPFQVSDMVSEKHKADVILITHGHHDHCSLADIEKIANPAGCEIVIPIDCQSKINKIIDKINLKINIATVGLKVKVGGINFYSFPAYNIGKTFHQREEGWMGYMLKLDDVIIYHSGDTDKIPEMDNLVYVRQDGEEFVLLLPVSGTYSMTAEEAAEVAMNIKPNIAIPMHYGSIVGSLEDAERFKEICKANGVHALILDKK